MKTILIVDDNEDLGRIIKRILDKEGFETILALNGDEALEKIKNSSIKPDLILLDIMMPGTPVAEIVDQLSDIKIAPRSVESGTSEPISLATSLPMLSKTC